MRLSPANCSHYPVRANHATVALTPQIRGIKAMVEKQLRTQADTQEALRVHTSLITSEVCDMLKRYLNASLANFSKSFEARFEARLRALEGSDGVKGADHDLDCACGG